MTKKRSIYMVAGRDAIEYAEVAISSLFRNCQDEITFTLLTDSSSDRDHFEAMLARVAGPVYVTVLDEAACEAKARVVFRDYAKIRAFRKGHPCWRKITDPSLFADPEEEVIVLDPDLYFPNPFHFEATPKGQLLLMRQKRHCLLPPEAMQAAFSTGLKIAHHTDIGVAQHSGLPWDWIDDLIGQLGGEALPRVPHVESIIWAMIAMRIGGGYLDPSKWRCWERTLGKRLLMLIGMRGPQLFRLEPISKLKCFHASSGAKNWITEAAARGIFKGSAPQIRPSTVRAFIEITQEDYENGERHKHLYHTAMRKLNLLDPFQVPK